MVCVATALHSQSPVQLKPPRITELIDETARVTLTGNTHPSAQAHYDRGPAPVSMPANRLLLVLTRSKQQEADLQTYLQSVQDSNSPNYHKFISPEEFGRRYGIGDSDLQTIETWLAGHGLKINRVAKGRTAIEISGTIGQIQNAFHTSIHSYVIGGKQYWANATDPQIPEALSPVVAGLASLNSFKPRAQYVLGPGGVYDPSKHTITPTYTVGNSTNGYYIFLGPADAATIYNTPTSFNANLSGTAYDGTGVTIGIAGDSNINLQQNANYRSTFGLPAKATTVVVDGADPGENGDAIEAYLDTQVAGGLAPNANVILYTAADTNFQSGLFLAIARALDDNQADILNVSFGACESAIGAAGNQYISSLWEQAAAQGIAVTVSSGDSGSAGCDNPNTEHIASSGLAVNGIGSTPYNISVGGTDYDTLYSAFPSSFTNYVDVTNTLPDHRSALKYIPEEPWNDSAYPNTSVSQDKPLSSITGNTASNNIIAGGGGISTVYALPSWQSGFSAATGRSLPDVSLLAGNGFYGAVWGICTDLDPSGADCAAGATGNSFNLTGIGGTSAAAPAFAGMLALVEQKTGARLGQADYVLYDLAKSKYATVFHDATAGNNSVNCAANTPDCAFDAASYFFLTGYNAASGYDEATGLGSVDATQLMNNWAAAGRVATSSSLQLNGATTALNITHGQSVTVNANVTSANGTPTGDIALVDNLSPATQPNAESITSLTLSGGSAAGTTNLLPGGSYQVSAHYGGSSGFAESDSNAIPVTVGAESSTTNLKVAGYYDPATGKAATTPYYGFIYLLDAQPYGNSASATSPDGAAAGTITFSNGAATLGTAALSSSGIAELQTTALPGGANSLTAAFPGDASFLASTSAPVAFSVVPAVTTLNTPNLWGGSVAGTAVPMSVTLSVDSAGTAPTGTVTFQDGSTTLGTVPLAGTAGTGTAPAGGTASFKTSTMPAGTHSITAVYSGDGNYGGTTSPTASYTVYPMGVSLVVITPSKLTPVNQPVSVTVNLFPVESNGIQAPTGTVTLTYNGVTSPAVSVVNSSATITIPANTLPVGNTTVTANYGGDLYYASGSGTGVISMEGSGTLTPSITVTGPTTISNYPIPVTVTVSGGSGNPVPTGSVSITNGITYGASQPLTNGTSTFTIQNNLVGGLNTFTATYLGDSNYTIGTGSGTVTVFVTPNVYFPSYAPSIVVNQSLDVTVNVANPPNVAAPTGTITLSCGTYTSPPAQLAAGSATITIPANSLPVGNDTLTASYSGDSNYDPGTGSEPVSVTAVPNPGLAVSGTTIAVVRGATTGNTSTITVTPSGGFTGSVALSAAITSSPAGAVDQPTLSFGTTSPVNITGTSSVTATLTVKTTAPTSAALHRPARPGWLGGGAALACVLLFGISARRRRWQTLLGLVVFLIFLGGGVLSCGGGGGGSSGGGGGNSNPGTTTGSYLVTITASSGSTSAQCSITLQVQ